MKLPLSTQALMLFFIKIYVMTKQVPHTLERNSIWISVSRLLSARAKRTTFQSRIWSCSGAYLAIVYFFSAAKSNRWDVFTFLYIMELLLWTKISVKLRSKSVTRGPLSPRTPTGSKTTQSRARVLVLKRFCCLHSAPAGVERSPSTPSLPLSDCRCFFYSAFGGNQFSWTHC